VRRRNLTISGKTPIVVYSGLLPSDSGDQSFAMFDHMFPIPAGATVRSGKPFSEWNPAGHRYVGECGLTRVLFRDDGVDKRREG
jgi:hypothetical protein